MITRQNGKSKKNRTQKRDSLAQQVCMKVFSGVRWTPRTGGGSAKRPGTHGSDKGVRDKAHRLGQDLFPDQALYFLICTGLVCIPGGESAVVIRKVYRELGEGRGLKTQ